MLVTWLDLNQRGALGEIEGLDASALDLCVWIIDETARRGGARIHEDDLHLMVGAFSVLEQIEGLQILGLVKVS